MLTPLKDTDHVAGVFFLGAADAAVGLVAQHLVLPRCFGPGGREGFVVGARTASAAPRAGGGRNHVETAGETQATALLGLYGFLQGGAPHHALGPVVGLGRVDGHVDLVHAGVGLCSQLADSWYADLGRVLGSFCYVLEDDEIAVLGEGRLDENGVARNDRIVIVRGGCAWRQVG